MASIAFFSKYLPSDSPNGVSVQVHRLAQALVRRSHDVTCFSFSSKPFNAAYHHVKLQWKGQSVLSRKIYPAIAFSTVPVDKFDIVHYHGDDYLAAGSVKRVRTFYGSALQEALHAMKAGRFYYQLLFYLFEWISCLKKGRLVAISNTTCKSLPFVKNIVPCCIPLDTYTVIGNKSETPSILFLGDLDSRKRGRLVIETFSRVVRPVFPNATLTVVGPQACSGDGILYVGNLSEDALIDQYRKSWIFCIASSYEGFGVPVIEAMACGTAVVATKNTGSKEIITHGINGMLCTPHTLGTTIVEVIKSPALRETLVREGNKTALRYDMDIVAQEYEKIYGIL